MSIKDFISNLLPQYYHTEDSYKDSNNRGLLLRIIEALGEEIDDNLIPKIEQFLDVRDIDITDGKFITHLSEFYGNPPDTLGNNQYRILLKYITALYKIKGTIRAFELYFSLLGFNVKILEYWKDNVRYDEFDFDANERYDEFCFGCSEYEVLFSSKDADCNNPQGSTIDLSTLTKLKEIVYLNEPINARLRALVQRIPICDEAKLCYREQIGWVISTRARWDDFNTDSTIRYDEFVVTDTGQLIDNNCLKELEWVANEVTDGTAVLDVASLLKPIDYFIERTFGRALLTVLKLYSTQANYSENTSSLSWLELWKHIILETGESTSASASIILKASPKTTMLEGTNGSAILLITPPLGVDLEELTDASALLIINELADGYTNFLEATQASASLIKTILPVTPFLENTSATGSFIVYSTNSAQVTYSEVTQQISHLIVTKLLQAVTNMLETTDAYAEFIKYTQAPVLNLEITDATATLTNVGTPVANFIENTAGYGAIYVFKLNLASTNMVEVTGSTSQLTVTKNLSTQQSEVTYGIGIIRGLNDVAVLFSENTDSSATLILTRLLIITLNNLEVTQGSATLQVTKFPTTLNNEVTSAYSQLSVIRNFELNTTYNENTYSIASLTLIRLLVIGSNMLETTNSNTPHLIHLFQLTNTNLENTNATAALILKLLVPGHVNFIENTSSTAYFSINRLASTQLVEVTNATAVLVVNELLDTTVQNQEITNHYAELGLTISKTVNNNEVTSSSQPSLYELAIISLQETTSASASILSVFSISQLNQEITSGDEATLIVKRLMVISTALSEVTNSAATLIKTILPQLPNAEVTDGRANLNVNDLKEGNVTFNEQTDGFASLNRTVHPRTIKLEVTDGKEHIPIILTKHGSVALSEVTNHLADIYKVKYPQLRLAEVTTHTGVLIVKKLYATGVNNNEVTTAIGYIDFLALPAIDMYENSDSNSELIVKNLLPISTNAIESTLSNQPLIYKVKYGVTNNVESTGHGLVYLSKTYKPILNTAQESTSSAGSLIVNDLKVIESNLTEVTSASAQTLIKVFSIGTNAIEVTTKNTPVLIVRDLLTMAVSALENTTNNSPALYKVISSSITNTENTASSAALLLYKLRVMNLVSLEQTSSNTPAIYKIRSLSINNVESTTAIGSLVVHDLLTMVAQANETTASSGATPYLVIGASNQHSEATDASAQLTLYDLKAGAVNNAETTSATGLAMYRVLGSNINNSETTHATAILTVNDLKDAVMVASEHSYSNVPSLIKVLYPSISALENTVANLPNLIHHILRQMEVNFLETMDDGVDPALYKVITTSVSGLETVSIQTVDLELYHLMLAYTIFREETPNALVAIPKLLLTQAIATALNEVTGRSASISLTPNTASYHYVIASYTPTFRYRMNLNGHDQGFANYRNDADTENSIIYKPNIIPNIATDYCASFNGTNSEYNLPNHKAINSGTGYVGHQWQFTFWFKTNNAARTSPQVIYEQGGTTTGICFYLSEGELLINLIANGSSAAYLGLTGVVDSEVYFVALTLDMVNEVMTLYINGVFHSAISTGVSAPLASHSGGIGIGGVDSNTLDINNNSISSNFSGELADLCIWGEEAGGGTINLLTEAEFTEIYTAGIS